MPKSVIVVTEIVASFDIAIDAPESGHATATGNDDNDDGDVECNCNCSCCVAPIIPNR